MLTTVVPSEGWEIMEPQKPDNSPGPGPEVTESRQKASSAKNPYLDSAE